MNRKIFLMPPLLLLAACATRVDMNAARQDIEELKTRVLVTEKGLSTVKTEAKEVAENSSRDALKNLDQLRKSAADLQANFEAMRIDLQVMAGKVDDVGVTAKKPYEDITLLKEDTSKSVGSLESRLKKLETDLEQTNGKLAALAKSLEAPPNPEKIYGQAVDVFKSGDTGKAREMLGKFIEQFRDHKLSASARYLIGETYYLEKNYEQAVLEFQRVIVEYPGKEKVPAAMLKQGLAFRSLGDIKSARFIIQELIDKFPDAEETLTAKDILAKLK